LKIENGWAWVQGSTGDVKADPMPRRPIAMGVARSVGWAIRPSVTSLSSHHVQTLAEIREMLESRGLAPRKSLGQNFLIDHNLIRKLVDASGVGGPGAGGAGDLVLEVGPGTGALTEELLARGCEVVASELDRGLAQLLRERFGGERGEGQAGGGRFTLVEGDVLATKRSLNAEVVAALGGRPFTLVANLPYAAGTPVMIALLVDHPECRGLYVTIQREVAERLLAGPGSKEYGPLAIIAQTLAEVSRVAVLPPECFWPRPEVTSAMVGVVRRGRALADIPPARLAEVAQQLFARRRKQLGSVLGRGFEFPEGIDPQSRVESLSLQQVLALAAKMG
jgi:16S rRNA (adenine1518-N6/adenine1519-N6)-dimethyltransferase